MSKKNIVAQEKSASNIETALKNTPGLVPVTSEPTGVQIPPKVEILSPQDKAELDDVKAKHLAAQDKMQNMVLQVQNAELTYNNTILRIALKYGLIDGDTINENGEITRKGK